MPELPLERYEFSRRDDQRLGRALQRTTQRCMRSFGFADFPLDPKPQVGSGGEHVVALTMTTVSPYGMLDLDQARRWGYGIEPDRLRRLRAGVRPKGRALTQQEYEVLYGFDAERGGRDVVNGRVLPEGGCSGEGMREVTGGAAERARLWGYVQERKGKIDKAVAGDRRVRDAFGGWSRCVVDKGFKRYENPSQAYRDKAWREGRKDGNTHRTKRELETAVADVECSRKLNVAGVWWVVSNEKQREELRRHKSRYEVVGKNQMRVRARVSEVLGER
ncbi:hypothetical protein [Streptomyces sp. NPDC058308]|uniref:hypothetical protein n=1 Tax=Streptomyces sp. NPDC058308 TaxID=3346440 RepID=UPI0036E9C11E